MKKKSKKSTKRKSKTDSVHQSLAVLKQMILNLEQQTKSLVAHIEQLRYSQSRFKDCETPVKKEDTNKYWPNVNEPPYTWNDNKYIIGFDGTDSAGII